MFNDIKLNYSIRKLYRMIDTNLRANNGTLDGIEITFRTYSGELYSSYYGDWESAIEDCMNDEFLLCGDVQIVGIKIEPIE